MQQKTARKRRHCPCPIRRTRSMQDGIKQMPMYEGMRETAPVRSLAVGVCWGVWVCSFLQVGPGFDGRIIFKLPDVHDYARFPPYLLRVSPLTG